MPLPTKVKKFLDKADIDYEVLNHKTVFTAFDKSQTLKLPEKIIGKTLVMKIDKEISLALIPANCNLDLKKFKKITKGKKVDFASEKLIKQKLKGVRLGAIPPFGVLWKIKTFVEKSLLKQKNIIVNAGDHNCSLKFSPSVLKKLIPNLIIGNFSKPKK